MHAHKSEGERHKCFQFPNTKAEIPIPTLLAPLMKSVNSVKSGNWDWGILVCVEAVLFIANLKVIYFSFQISHLERKLKTIQREVKDLRETNEELIQANASLKTASKKIHSELENQAIEIEELMKANQQIKAERNELAAMTDELNTESSCLKREIADMVLLRKENEMLLQKIQRLQETLESESDIISTGSIEGNSTGSCVCKTAAYNLRKKRRKNNSMKRYQRLLNRSIKKMSNVFEHFSKDGWEDITGSRYSFH